MKLCRLAALFLALALLGCGALADSSRSFLAMDTVISISADGADSLLLDACKTEVFRLENLMSVTKAGSDVSRLNTFGTAELSPETASVLRTALSAAQVTDGALDVTIYPIVRAWGFTTGSYRIPGEAELFTLMKRVGWEKIQLKGSVCTIPEGTMIDLGSVAKGYASDRLAAILKGGGVQSALVDLGGNVYCVGGKPDGSDWRVGIRDPEDGSALAAVVSVRDMAVVTSGAYERCFTGPDGKVYGHIFDPATGRPSESDLISATVIGPRGVQCDALSTALYVMGREKAEAFLPTLIDMDAILIDDYGHFWVTKGLKDIFAPAGAYETARIHWIE